MQSSSTGLTTCLCGHRSQPDNGGEQLGIFSLWTLKSGDGAGGGEGFWQLQSVVPLSGSCHQTASTVTEVRQGAWACWVGVGPATPTRGVSSSLPAHQSS